MVWTLFRQQQQRGAQIQPLPGKRRPRAGASSQQQAQEQSTLGETELEQDERGEDAEQTIDAQAEFDEPGRLDRND